MTRLHRKLPPCGFCRGPATSMSFNGPTAYVPLCEDCWPVAREALERKRRQ